MCCDLIVTFFWAICSLTESRYCPLMFCLSWSACKEVRPFLLSGSFLIVLLSIFV